jgi:lycopene cyclase domain-containing protein
MEWLFIKWLFWWVWLPTAIITLFYWRILWQYKRAIFITILGSLVVGFFWDLVARYYDIWYFPSTRILGIKLAGLPIEEYLFYISMSLFIASLTSILHYKYKNL